MWDINGAGDSTIQGFATDTSVNVGGTIGFKINRRATATRSTIYRIGYYQGNGARKQRHVSPSVNLPQTSRPACPTPPPRSTTAATGRCRRPGRCRHRRVRRLPGRAAPGRTPAAESHIPFVVRDDSSHSDVIFQTSDTTWQAYNLYGGSDFYQGAANGRAFKISYNRPFITRGAASGRDFFFSNEYPMIRFLEQNGYDVSYQRGGHRPLRPVAEEPQGVPVDRPRRVLVGCAAANVESPATPAST